MQGGNMELANYRNFLAIIEAGSFTGAQNVYIWRNHPSANSSKHRKTILARSLSLPARQPPVR